MPGRAGRHAGGVHRQHHRHRADQRHHGIQQHHRQRGGRIGSFGGAFSFGKGAHPCGRSAMSFGFFLIFVGAVMMGVGAGNTIGTLMIAGGVILGIAVLLLILGVAIIECGGPQPADMEVNTTATATVLEGAPDFNILLDQQYPVEDGDVTAAPGPPQAGIAVGQPYNPKFSAAAPPVYPSAPQDAETVPYPTAPAGQYTQPPYPAGPAPAAAVPAYPPAVAIPEPPVAHAQPYTAPGAIADQDAGGAAGTGAGDGADLGLPSYNDVIGE